MVQGKSMMSSHVLFGFVILLSSSCDSMFFGIQKTAEIYPQDALIFINDKLTVWVELIKEVDYNISEVSIVLRHKQKEIMARNLTAENITHGYVEITGAKEFAGKSSLLCYRGGEWISLCSSMVWVENRITPAKNDKAVWYYDDRLEVTWQRQVYFTDSINFTAQWEPLGELHVNSPSCWLSAGGEKCIPENYNSQVSITVGFTQKMAGFAEKRFTSNQAFIKTAEDPVFNMTTSFQIIPLRNIKPVTKDFNATSLTSHCVTVTWQAPRGIWYFSHDMIYSIQVSEIGESVTKTINETLLFANYKDNHDKVPVSPICNLKPATEYNAILRVKAPSTGYWSDPEEITFSTLEDRPDQAPHLMPTSFSTEPCDANGLRGATVYWNKPAKEYTHGKVTQYNISFWDHIEVVHPFYNHATYRIPCDTSVEVEMYSYTQVGRSLTSSKLVIPSEKEAFQWDIELDLDFKVKIDSHGSSGTASMTCSWTASDSEEMQGVTMVIYYCQAPPLAVKQCDGNFLTKEVPLSQQQAILSEVSSQFNLFGYGLKKGTQVAGIKWIDCIYDPRQEPKKLSVEASPGGGHGSIFASWKAQYCTYQALTLVLRYHMEVCPESANAHDDSCKVQTIEGRSSSNLYVDDLDPDQRYRVTVWGESDAGPGLESDPVLVTPNADPYEEDPMRNVYLVIGILVVLVISAVIVLIIFLRYARRRGNKISKFSYQPFDLPPDLLQKISKNSCSDSGRGSSRSTDSIEVVRRASLSTTVSGVIDDPMPISTDSRSVDDNVWMNMDEIDKTFQPQLEEEAIALASHNVFPDLKEIYSSSHIVTIIPPQCGSGSTDEYSNKSPVLSGLGDYAHFADSEKTQVNMKQFSGDSQQFKKDAVLTNASAIRPDTYSLQGIVSKRPSGDQHSSKGTTPSANSDYAHCIEIGDDPQSKQQHFGDYPQEFYSQRSTLGNNNTKLSSTAEDKEVLGTQCPGESSALSWNTFYDTEKRELKGQEQPSYNDRQSSVQCFSQGLTENAAAEHTDIILTPMNEGKELSEEQQSNNKSSLGQTQPSHDDYQSHPQCLSKSPPGRAVENCIIDTNLSLLYADKEQSREWPGSEHPPSCGNKASIYYPEMGTAPPSQQQLSNDCLTNVVIPSKGPSETNPSPLTESEGNDLSGEHHFNKNPASSGNKDCITCTVTATGSQSKQPISKDYQTISQFLTKGQSSHDASIPNTEANQHCSASSASSSNASSSNNDYSHFAVVPKDPISKQGLSEDKSTCNQHDSVDVMENNTMDDIRLFMENIPMKPVQWGDSMQMGFQNSKSQVPHCTKDPAVNGIERKISEDSGVASPGVKFTGESPPIGPSLAPFTKLQVTYPEAFPDDSPYV